MAGLAFGKEGIPFLALEIGLFVLAIIGMVLLFPQGEDASCSLDTGAMPSFTIDMPNPNAFDLETTPDTNLLIAFKDKEFDFTDRDAKLFDFNDKQCLPPCCEGDAGKCATGCSDSMLDCLETRDGGYYFADKCKPKKCGGCAIPISKVRVSGTIGSHSKSDNFDAVLTASSMSSPAASDAMSAIVYHALFCYVTDDLTSYKESMANVVFSKVNMGVSYGGPLHGGPYEFNLEGNTDVDLLSYQSEDKGGGYQVTNFALFIVFVLLLLVTPTSLCVYIRCCAKQPPCATRSEFAMQTSPAYQAGTPVVAQPVANAKGSI